MLMRPLFRVPKVKIFPRSSFPAKIFPQKRVNRDILYYSGKVSNFQCLALSVKSALITTSYIISFRSFKFAMNKLTHIELIYH